MAGRIVVLSGWRAYVLGAVVLALLLALVLAASVVVLAVLAVAALALVSHRALRALGLVRSRPRGAAPSSRIIEGEYQVVECRLDGHPPPQR